MVTDAAARDVLLLFAGLPNDLGHALLDYLSLWRPSKRDLSYARTLKIAHEVLALDPDRSPALAWGLSETAQSLRTKGGALPITSHNYLKRVLSGAPQPTNLPALNATATPKRRAAGALSGAAQAVASVVENYAE